MWTPKRILLMILGWGLFFAGYQVYAHYLGRYDGLPPLPSDHRPQPGRERPAPVYTRPPDGPAANMLKMAFGTNCKEIDRRIKLSWRTQGVVMAADDWALLDGKLELKLVSVAIFGKPAEDGNPEVNTIRGVRALIEFDQPLRDPRDAINKNRKPVGGRLEGGFNTELSQPMQVHLQNNRRTANTEDDLHLYTDWLAFRDDQHRIWTDEPVEIVDGVRPHATVVTATGMEVILIPGEPSPAAVKKNKPTINGVKHVRLDRDVRMELQIESQSGFLGREVGEESSSKAARDKPDKTSVFISSKGPFVYHVEQDRDRAEFSERVSVIRPQAPPLSAGDTPGWGALTGKYDQLDCDQLVLVFERKGDEDKKRPPNDRRIKPVLVTARASGERVVLASDSERLQATAKEMLYDKAANQTTLLGNPVVADQDGHELVVNGALTLQNLTRDAKAPLQARVKGPGRIRMRGRDGQPNNLIAQWHDELRTSREGDLERLVFKGKASFEDPDHGKMQADQIVVKLESVAGDKNTAEKKRRVPKSVEATDNVSVVSKDLVIPKTDRLRLDFEEAKTKPGPVPPGAEKPDSSLLPLPSPQPAPPNPSPGAPEYLPSKKQPMVLTARWVEAKLLRMGSKTDLDWVEAEGKVQVTQKAVNKGDKPVDIQGHRLKLTHTADGNVLHVVGSEEVADLVGGGKTVYVPAYVQIDKLRILGPSVEIDQLENVVRVTGAGSLKMPSQNDFQGKQLEQPADVTVHWNERMIFSGIWAEFEGGVAATQNQSSLACHTLRVLLDRAVSLKEKQLGQKDQTPSLSSLNAHQNVRLEKTVREGEKLRSFQRVEGEVLVFDKTTSTVNVSGPGVVYLLQAGAKAFDALQPGAPKPAAGADPTLKLTKIEYGRSMQIRKAEDKTTDLVEFIGPVELVHLPANDPDIAINKDRLPPEGFLLRCQRLEGLSRKVPGQPNQETTMQDFKATGKVSVRAREFQAFGDTASYEGEKDLLILEGSRGFPASLARQLQQGGDREPIRAQKIWYWRSKNKVQTDRTESIGVNP